MDDIFSLLTPKTPLPLIFDSPHSGTEHPDDFDFACTPEDLEGAVDRYVDELFARAPELGATLLKANFPRAYVDVNRAIDDIDPQLIETQGIENQGDLPKPNPSARSDAGIGLIWRLAKPEIPIYNKKLTISEISKRIETFYTPYHAKLSALIDDAHTHFGQVYHINCHSMPSTTATPKKPVQLVGHKPRQADFCLGTRDGTTCDNEFTQEIRRFLQDLGYHVTVNDPFKGVELVERYSDPARGRHSLQLEINRALYMDEDCCKKNNNYDSLRDDIEKMIHFCADFVQARLSTRVAD